MVKRFSPNNRNAQPTNKLTRIHRAVVCLCVPARVFVHLFAQVNLTVETFQLDEGNGDGKVERGRGGIHRIVICVVYVLCTRAYGLRCVACGNFVIANN